MVSGKGGVKSSTAAGVWAMGSSGALGLLFRTGDTLDGKKLKSFTLLNATPGALGSTRSFNSAGQVGWRATFTDKSTAIVRTDVP